MNKHAPSRKLIMFIGLWTLCLLATLAACFLLGVIPAGIDDAYIFFVYAENFANGDGFVYNTGSEKVEGFSSLLWTLLLAVLYFLGLDSYPYIFLLTSFFSTVSIWATLDIIFYGLRRLNLGPPSSHNKAVPLIALVAVAWLFAAPGWYLWNAASLMDLALWNCLLLLFVRHYLLLVHNPAADIGKLAVPALLIALMVITRPEAMAWGLFLLGSLVALLRWKSLRVLPSMALPVATYGGTLLLLLAFRLAYFGYPFPNTYYAKVSPEPAQNIIDGLSYFGRYLIGAGFAGLFTVVALVLGFRSVPIALRLLFGQVDNLNENHMARLFLGFVICTGALLAVVVGGDHFGGFRLFQPMYPVVCLFAFYWWLIRQTESHRGEIKMVSVIWVPLVLAGLFVLLEAPVRGAWHNIKLTKLKVEFDVASEGRATARALVQLAEEAHLTQLPSVGVTGAGGFKYEWDGLVLDLMGLNSVEMGHSAGQRKGRKGHAAFHDEVFYKYPPDVMLPHLTGWDKVLRGCRQIVDPKAFAWTVLNGLPGQDRFAERYKFVWLDYEEQRLCMFITSEMLETLKLDKKPGFRQIEWLRR